MPQVQETLEALGRTEDGVYVVDEAHHIVFWNSAAERILGYRAEEVLGRMVWWRALSGACQPSGTCWDSSVWCGWRQLQEARCHSIGPLAKRRLYGDGMG